VVVCCRINDADSEENVPVSVIIGEFPSEPERSQVPNPVTHFEVLGKDAAALQSFYAGAFGWQMQDVMNGSYYMIDPGGGINGGVGAAPEGGGHVTFYVEVDDPAAALEKISSLGGRTIQEPMDVPGGPTIALFADPEGHLVGLVKGMEQ
jgi:predicted enzyme related to lactoylglutathione lyase